MEMNGMRQTCVSHDRIVVCACFTIELYREYFDIFVIITYKVLAVGNKELLQERPSII